MESSLTPRDKFLAGAFIVYILYCTAAPFIEFTANFKLFIHDFRKDGTSDWLAYDLALALGILLYPFLTFIKSDRIRKPLVNVLILDAIWELIDLIVDNNQKSKPEVQLPWKWWEYIDLIVQNSILIGSLIYLWKKWKPKTLQR